MVRSAVACLAAVLGAACGRIGYDAVDDAGPALRLVPATATINLSTALPLTAVDGTAPYGFHVEAGAGSVDADGRFFAPARAGTSTVTVTDARGATASAQIHHEGSLLFALGGAVGGVPTDAVLTSPDGATWQQIGHLPGPRESGAAVVYEDRIYYLGGVDAALASTTTVWSSADGITWLPAGELPAPATSGAATVHRRQLWFLGGWHDGNLDGVHTSRDGATWTPAAPLPTGRHEMDAFSRGDRLYLVGGHDATTFLTDIIHTDGTSWLTGPGATNIAIDFAASGELDDLVFHGAGTGSVAMETSRDLVTWSPAAPLPDSPREGAALIGHRGRMLLIGGHPPVLATTDGASWSTIGSLPDARSRIAVVQFTPP